MREPSIHLIDARVPKTGPVDRDNSSNIRSKDRMKRSKSKASSKKQGVGLGETEDLTDDQAAPADDGFKHVPLPEATIETNLGGRFLIETLDGQQREVRIARSSGADGHWEAFDLLGALRVVSTNEVISLVTARPDDSLAEQAGSANQSDNNPLVDSAVAATDPCHEPNPTDPEKVRAEPLAEPGTSEDAAAAPPEEAASNAKNRKKGHDDPFSWRKGVPKKLHDLGDKCIVADGRTAAAEKSFVEAYYDEGDLLSLFKKALQNAGIKRGFVKLCNDRMGIDPTRRKRAMRAYNYLSARGGRAACKNYETLTGLLREIADSANDDDEAGPGEPATAARKGKGGRRKPNGTVDDDAEGAGGYIPAADSGGKGAVVEDSGETPAEDSGGKGAAIDTTDESAGRETPAEGANAKGAAVVDSGETPAEDAGGEGAAIEDSGGETAAVDTTDEDVAVDVDADVQRPVNDSERELCRTYINGIGNLARAEFVFMQVKVDDSQA